MSVYDSASVKINNDQEWWVSGGVTATSDSVLYDGESISPFESLPNNDYFHHMIAVNQTYVIYIGTTRKAGVFDLSTNTWSNFTPLPNVS